MDSTLILERLTVNIPKSFSKQDGQNMTWRGKKQSSHAKVHISAGPREIMPNSDFLMMTTSSLDGKLLFRWLGMKMRLINKNTISINLV